MNLFAAHLKTFDVRNASPAAYAVYHAYASQMRQERLPDDPPLSLEAIRADLAQCARLCGSVYLDGLE